MSTLEALHPVTTRPRAVIYRTRGRTHGPITRLMSPGDLGEILKPFVFLDHIDTQGIATDRLPNFGLHPHSGIATLTWLFEGSFNYEDTLGRHGELRQGSVEWMQAGAGAWHGGGFGKGGRLRGFQLWLALPPESELGEAHSLYLPAQPSARHGPVTVLLGHYESARGMVEAPTPINYFSVSLKAGEAWRYQPPRGHDVAWAAVHTGQLRSSVAIEAGEIVAFEAGEAAIEFEAEADTDFVVGSAARHPHDLVLGYYSVHTSAAALAKGEARIQELGQRLRELGRR